MIPDSALESGRGKFQDRIADPEQKAKIVAEMKASLHRKGREDFAYAVIASYRHDKSLDGLNIVEAAKAKRGSGSLDDQVEMILDIQSTAAPAACFTV